MVDTDAKWRYDVLTDASPEALSAAVADNWEVFELPPGAVLLRREEKSPALAYTQGELSLRGNEGESD